LYAIIKSGGKQYRVTEGQTIKVERLEGAVGDEITFSDVLFVSDEENPEEKPAPGDIHVAGTIVEQAKSDKVLVFRFKRRKMYRRLTGHRQLFTGVRIGALQAVQEPSTKKKRKAAKSEGAAEE
jgi:large subunit ribosomal protein L21